MRRLIGLLLGVVVLVAGASALWTYLAAEVPEASLVLVEVEGSVELSRPGATQQVAAAPGAVLEARDRVTTGAGAAAVLALGRDTRIRLGPVSAVEVRSVGADEVRLELENGALEATVRPESGALRVGSRGREVIATNGTFAMGVRGDLVQVSAQEGEVVLSGVDRTRLVAGEQATIFDRTASVGAIPDALLLEVDWPAPSKTTEAAAAVRGRTAPGAEVHIVATTGEQVAVTADRAGVFVAEVPLGEGPNPVTVRAGDVLGRTAEEAGSLPQRDTEAVGGAGGPADYGLDR